MPTCPSARTFAIASQMPKADLSNAEARRVALAAQGFDRLVARVDLKADRQKGVLRARCAFIEPGRPVAPVAAALAGELKLMATWLELDRVVVGRKGDLVSALRSELKNGSN